MSLQLIAKQMEAKGRKGDSMLVHMTPGEVAGLQSLARAAGGTLTVNPETGLVEANFLKRMLPTLVGLGVGAATMNPMAGAAAGAAVGGYQAKRDDQDVGMGMLMGGLGGYGGASLAGGLGAAGAAGATGTTAAGANVAGTAGATVGQQAGALTAEQIANQQILDQVAAEAATRQATELAAKQTANQLTGAEAAQTAINNPTVVPFAERTAGDAAAQQYAQAVTKQQALQPQTQFFDDGSSLTRAVDGTFTSTPGTDVVVAKQPPTYGENFENFKRGFGEMGKKSGRTKFAEEFGMTEAGASLAPMMAPGKKEKPPEADDEMIMYDYDVGRTGAERAPSGSSAERSYFEGRYTPARRIRARDYPFAEGGAVDNVAVNSTAAPTSISPLNAGIASGMTGASAQAFDYLMGNAASSATPVQGIGALRPFTPAAPRADQMYSFNPTTGVFTRNPNYVEPVTEQPAVEAPIAGGDGGGGGSNDTTDITGPTTPATTGTPNTSVTDINGLDLGGDSTGLESLSPDAVADALAEAGFPDTGYDDTAPDMSDFAGSDAPDGLSAESVADALADAGYADSGYNDAAPDMSDFGVDSGESSGESSGGGCVIATHAVASGAFTAREKRQAELWCIKQLHHKWWGEAIRRGYRYHGRAAIKNGNAARHYQEFRDFVDFGSGKRRNAKTAFTFAWRSVQFFFTGLFVKNA